MATMMMMMMMIKIQILGTCKMPGIMLNNLHELLTLSLFLQQISCTLHFTDEKTKDLDEKTKDLDLRKVTERVNSTVRHQSHVCPATRLKPFDLTARRERSHLGRHHPTDTLHSFNPPFIQSMNLDLVSMLEWNGKEEMHFDEEGRLGRVLEAMARSLYFTVTFRGFKVGEC